MTRRNTDDTLQLPVAFLVRPSHAMHQATEVQSIPSVLGETIKRHVFAVQDYSLLALQALMDAFTPPQYWTDTLEQMDLIGVGSLPIVVITSFFIGGVMVLQTAAQFQRFGETALTGDAVSLALVRELGPAITALLVAGRNASGIASELGSMIVTEQVDAMRALGTDPVRKLVAPRLVATVIMMFFLTIIADACGIAGGALVAVGLLGLEGSAFFHTAFRSLIFGDVIEGLTKPLFSGFIIATVGCFYGLRTTGGTQGVGRSTTQAVVASSVLIILFDFLVTKMMIGIFGR